MSKSGFALLPLFASLFAVACAAPTETSEATESDVNESAIMSKGGSSACSGCTNKGDFALKATGEGFKSLAGKRVSIAAVQPDLGSQVTKPFVTLSTKIDSKGRFTLSCDRALTENYGYPSYGIWLDQNGDGKCGAGDLAIVNADFYGWDSDISVVTRPSGTVIPPSESWRTSTAWEPADTAHRWGNDEFCEYYGFPQ